VVQKDGYSAAPVSIREQYQNKTINGYHVIFTDVNQFYTNIKLVNKKFSEE
jgi:hypothetical protein